MVKTDAPKPKRWQKLTATAVVWGTGTGLLMTGHIDAGAWQTLSWAGLGIFTAGNAVEHVAKKFGKNGD